MEDVQADYLRDPKKLRDYLEEPPLKVARDESMKSKRTSGSRSKRPPEIQRNVSVHSESRPRNAGQRQPKGAKNGCVPANSPKGSKPLAPTKHRARKTCLSDTEPRRSPRNHIRSKHIDPGGSQTEG